MRLRTRLAVLVCKASGAVLRRLGRGGTNLPGKLALKIDRNILGELARGVKVTGATVHYVDEGTDTGPILFQTAVEVQPDDTPKTLQQRVMEQAEWVLLPQAINAIANGRI